MTRDYISDHMVLADEAGNPVLDEHGKPRLTVFDTSFASENWNKAIRDRTHPGLFVRRHLEACVLTYLAEELRTGDVAVDGAQAYASWADQLISGAPSCCRTSAPRSGCPTTHGPFGRHCIPSWPTTAPRPTPGYPDNADLVIDDAGRPSLKQYRAPRPTDTALALEAALRRRMPERTLLGVLARTAHWLEWHRRFSPASGSDPSWPTRSSDT